MARPKAPSNIHELRGSYTNHPERRRYNPAPVDTLAEPPPAPDWLPNGHAVAEWARLTRILAANKLLTEGGLSALATLCAVHGKLVQLWTASETPRTSLLAQHRCLTSDFGLTPASQGRARHGGPDKGPNAFSNNGKRL